MCFAAVCRADMKHKYPFQLPRLFYQRIRRVRKKKAAGFRKITVSLPGGSNFRQELLDLRLADNFQHILLPPQAGISIASVILYQRLGKILLNDFFGNTISFNGCFLVDILFIRFSFFVHVKRSC